MRQRMKRTRTRLALRMARHIAPWLDELYNALGYDFENNGLPRRSHEAVKHLREVGR